MDFLFRKPILETSRQSLIGLRANLHHDVWGLLK